MYLADTAEYKHTFEIFISFPEDKYAKKQMSQFYEFLFPNRHTSYNIDGVYGLAFFEDSLSQETKDFIMDRFNGLIYHDIEYGPRHNKTVETVLYDGVKISKNVEVDCFYFYDDVRLYE